MKTIVTSQIDANGVLNVTVPLGHQVAGKSVRVTVETMEDATSRQAPLDRESWLRFIEKTAGSITDPTFVRQPQGQLEEREPLS